ncbi:MAG: hypothetical protein K6F98_06825 [Bacteroidales bacterium]|nr:hypothetical protein [Bacteroidales bacterium]
MKQRKQGPLIQWLGFILAVAVLSACEEQTPLVLPDDTPSEAAVWCAETMPDRWDIEGVTSLTLSLCRRDTSYTLTLPVSMSADRTFQAPSQVQFARGEAEATLTLTFNPETLPYNVDYPLRFVLGDASTPAGTTGFLMTATRVYPWESRGKVWYREDLLTSVYDESAPTEYEVELEESKKNPGYYRLIAPYDGKYRYSRPGTWNNKETYYLEIHAENPRKVWIPRQPIGLDWGRGMASVASTVIEAGGTSRTAYGTLQDGVITFPANSIVITCQDGGSTYTCNTHSRFRVLLPGIPLVYDYNVDFEYEPYYMGTVVSALHARGTSSPGRYFQQQWSLNFAENLVYLDNYFGEGHGLAFHMDDAYHVTDVWNAQATGMSDSTGRELYVRVEDSRIIEYDSEHPYPVRVAIDLQLLAYDADGTVAEDLGVFTEICTLSRKINHVWDDLKGGTLQDYLGTWRVEARDWLHGGTISYRVSVADAGRNAAGERILTIRNLSGSNNAFNDVISAVYRNEAIYVSPQPLPDAGDGRSVSLYLFVPDLHRVLRRYELMGCICEDGCLVFLSMYGDVNLNGLYYAAPDAAGEPTTVLAVVHSLCGTRSRWPSYSVSSMVKIDDSSPEETVPNLDTE